MSHSISTMAHFNYNKNITYKTLFYLQWYSYTFKALKGLRSAGNGIYGNPMVEGMNVSWIDAFYINPIMKF